MGVGNNLLQKIVLSNDFNNCAIFVPHSSGLLTFVSPSLEHNPDVIINSADLPLANPGLYIGGNYTLKVFF